MKTNTPLPTGDGFIRQPELLKLTGLSPSTLLRLEQRGDFPHRIKLDQRSVGWSILEVKQWMDERKTNRNLNESKDSV
jgi:prophage regulatory protein